MYTPQGLQYILQVYCYYVEVYLQYGHILQFLRHWSITERNADAILHCVLQIHCIGGSIPSVYTAAY